MDEIDATPDTQAGENTDPRWDALKGLQTDDAAE